jgi:hypothetical protein
LNLFEAFLARAITRFSIRVMFTDQLPVRLSDVVLASFCR